MGKQDAPLGLGDAGVTVWRGIVEQYDLRADELNTLEHVCRMTDMIAAIDADWEAEGRPLRTTGSMGQLVEHPAVGSLHKHRMAINTLWRQLKLPDSAEGGARPNQQRQAAQTRWAAAHGA